MAVFARYGTRSDGYRRRGLWDQSADEEALSAAQKLHGERADGGGSA